MVEQHQQIQPQEMEEKEMSSEARQMRQFLESGSLFKEWAINAELPPFHVIPNCANQNITVMVFGFAFYRRKTTDIFLRLCKKSRFFVFQYHDAALMKETVDISMPKWAHDSGFPLFHLQLQKKFKAEKGKGPLMENAQSKPDWTWESIEAAIEAKQKHFKNYSCWGAIYSGINDRYHRVEPGGKVTFTNVHFQVWNNKRDTCIQQNLWMIDDQIAYEFYSGVPCGGVTKKFPKVEFTAPKKPGLYLVEQCNDLQYTMANARKNKLK